MKSLGDGRVYAGLRGNWGATTANRVGYVPMYAWLADHDVDQVGFDFRTLNSLSTDIEATFDEKSLAQYQMLGIRYLLLPAGHAPPVPATLIASAGGSQALPRCHVGVLPGRRSVDGDHGGQNRRRAGEPHVAPVRPRAPRRLSGRRVRRRFATRADEWRRRRSPGVVLSDTEDRAGGVFAASVEMRRPAVVLLKASYDPSWTATVDGRAVKPVMMAPSLVGVEVGPGRHLVRFQYASYGAYPALFAIGILALLALTILPRRPDFASPTRLSSVADGPLRVCKFFTSRMVKVVYGLTLRLKPFTVPPVGR